MRLYRDRAVVLRQHKLGEADRIVTLLTRDHGLVRAVAKGVRRTRSKFGSRLEPFAHVDVQLHAGRNLDIVTQVVSIDALGSDIVRDYGRYTCACAILETAERLAGEERAPAPVLHRLTVGVPAIAHAAKLRRPTVDDWNAINRQVPRLVDALPNGPQNHTTVRVFLAGGVPEVMLHLRGLGMLRLDVLTVTGQCLGDVLAEWETSERRRKFRELLTERDGVQPDQVIMSPDLAKQRGLTSTVTFPTGNLAPEGSVIKSTAIDPRVVGVDGVYRKRGPARVFTRERDAVAGIKSGVVKPGDVIVLICGGPMGTGMEETYQVTSALKHLKWGKEVAVITDARFSGVSTGACIGHVSPEALAGGPIGKLRDGDMIEIVIDRINLVGTVNFVGDEAGLTGGTDYATAQLAARSPRPDLAAHPALPDDTRLWAALQQASGGVWGGCVYDADAIIGALRR